MDKKIYEKPVLSDEILQLEDIIAVSSQELLTFDDSDETFPGGGA